MLSQAIKLLHGNMEVFTRSTFPVPGPGCVSPSLLCSSWPGECELVNKIDQIDRKVQITFLCNLIKLQRSPAHHTSVPYRAVRTPNTHIVTTIRSDKINLQISELNFILLCERKQKTDGVILSQNVL